MGSMKKTIVLLALFLCVAMVVGCGKTAEKPSQPTAVTDAVADAKTAIQSGDVRRAYDLLKAEDGDEAKAMLKNFAFVLTKEARNDGPATAYTYDDNGNLTVEDYTNTGGVDPEYWSKTVYTHDAAGRVLTEERTNFDGYWETVTRAYDEKGNEIRVTDTDGDGGAYTLTATYDDNGNVLTKRFDYEDGYFTETAYTYDERGNQLTATMTTGASDSESYWERGVSTYDENDRLLTDTWSNSTVGIIYDNTYTYENDGNVVIRCDLSDPDGDLSTTTTFTYADDGSGLTVDVVWKNSEYRKVVYTYDADGRILTKTVSTREATQEDYVCTYDADGNLLTKESTMTNLNHVTTYTWELRYYPNGAPAQVSALADSVYLEDKQIY